MIQMAKMPTTDEWVERIGNKVLNEYVYEGRTLKEWIDLMASGKLVILPNNATNGDVIKALFPDGSQVKGAGIYVMNDNKSNVFYDFDWWNASYKGGNDGLQNKD